MRNDMVEHREVKAEVVQALRNLAGRGATVAELVREIQTRLGYPDPVILPVLWYLMKAFDLPLKDVLPLREWIGTSNGEAMNRLLQPRIEATRHHWEDKPTESVAQRP